MPGLALRHFGEIDLHAGAAAARRLAGRAGEPRRAHVLDAGHGVGGEQLEARLEQQLFAERIAHLHGRAVLLRFLGQIARGKRRAREPVAPRLRADVEDRIADALRRAARDLLVPQHAEVEDIHQRIAVVAFVEIDLAADGRDADAIAVVRDARDHAGEEPAVRLALRARRRVIGPKRSEFSEKTGRAPIVKMSRMIPPTPVAAPWNGSIALG